jgi:hypothetical protein
VRYGLEPSKGDRGRRLGLGGWLRGVLRERGLREARGDFFKDVTEAVFQSEIGVVVYFIAFIDWSECLASYRLFGNWGKSAGCLLRV